MICVLAWFWSMGSFLGSITKSELKLEAGFFRFALGYSAVYMFVFFSFMLNPGPVPAVIIVPLHLLCMYCLFYILYFVSKTLTLVELGKALTLYDYAGTFFLLWFYPIGIWFIQPKVNRLYTEKGKREDSLTQASLIA